MDKQIQFHVKKLLEGCYLATSDNLQGLVAQDRTIAETIEVTRDVINKLLEGKSMEKVMNQT